MKASMFFRRAFSLATLSVLLAACQHMPAEPTLEVRQSLTEKRPADCPQEDDNCPLVNIDTLTFADEPALNQLIDERLRRMTLNSPEATLPQTLQGYQRDFLRNAEPGWSSYLQAKLRDQHGPLMVIELSSYLYTGGAHGMPGRGFINYDREQDRQLRLEDILLPGQQQAFWRLAEQAHQRWLINNQHDQEPEFTNHWPFVKTENIALLKDRVLLKYDVYSIAPYASGHPELSIPYAKLKGILRPELLR